MAPTIYAPLNPHLKADYVKKLNKMYLYHYSDTASF